MKCSSLAFSVQSADYAVAVFVSIEIDDVFADLVVDFDVAAVWSHTQLHPLFAAGLIGGDRAFAP